MQSRGMGKASHCPLWPYRLIGWTKGGPIAQDAVDDSVDVGDIDLAITIDISSRRAIITILDDINDRIDIRDIYLAIDIHVGRPRFWIPFLSTVS